MSLGGAKRAGVVQASKRPAGHNLGCVLNQRRRNLPFSPTGMVIGGFLICTAIGYLVYAKKKPEASAQEVARVPTNITNPDDTGRKGTSISAVH